MNISTVARRVALRQQKQGMSAYVRPGPGSHAVVRGAGTSRCCDTARLTCTRDTLLDLSASSTVDTVSSQLRIESSWTSRVARLWGMLKQTPRPRALGPSDDVRPDVCQGDLSRLHAVTESYSIGHGRHRIRRYSMIV